MRIVILRCLMLIGFVCAQPALSAGDFILGQGDVVDNGRSPVCHAAQIVKGGG